MLSRAVLPLARPLASAATPAVRASAFAAQRPRWYVKPKGKGKKIDVKPGSTIRKAVPSSPNEETQSTQEQPEFETAAQPGAQSNAVRSRTPRHRIKYWNR